MNNRTIDYFEALAASEILQEPAGKWGDSDLLDVLALFEEQNDTERKTAVLELILTSPDNNSELINYNELYDDLIYATIYQNNFVKAVYWTVAALTYEIQHYNHPLNVRNSMRQLAEIYLLQENFDTGLQLATRLLQTDPADYWTHNNLALVLPEVGLPNLAITILKSALASAKNNDPENLISQLQELYDELVEASETSVIEPVEVAVSTPSAIKPDTLAQLNVALALPPLPVGAKPVRYLPPVTNLLNQGDTLDETLQQTIVEQGNALLPELLQLAFDEDYWGTAVNRHTISLLNKIHKTESILGSLSHWLDQATDENWPQLLCKYTGKIGGFTTPELKTLISNTELDTFIRSAAAEALFDRLEKTPKQRSNIIEYCRHLLTRKEAYEASEELFIALLIANIIDTDAKELYPEIKQVFDEDRLDPTITDLPYIHEEWDMPPLPSPEIRKDGLYVLLKCTKCQRTREHFVQHVTIDRTTLDAERDGQQVLYDPHIMDRAIICPKCGSIDHYKTDPLTSMRLTMGGSIENIMANMMGEEPKVAIANQFVSQARLQAFGQDMHPLVALNKYMQLALSNRKQAEPNWRIGNILRSIWRDEDALSAYRTALHLDPDDPWINYAVAATEHDLGNHDEAKALYQKAMQLISPLAMLKDEDLMDTSMSSAAGLKALKEGKPSPYSQDLRTPKEEKKLSRRERRAEEKRMKKLNKKKRR